MLLVSWACMSEEKQGLGDENAARPHESNKPAAGAGPCAVGLGPLDQLRGLQVGWAFGLTSWPASGLGWALNWKKGLMGLMLGP